MRTCRSPFPMTAQKNMEKQDKPDHLEVGKLRRFRADQEIITVGIADYKVSSSPDHVLATYALGSCVGLSLYDRRVGIGGLIHCMLPLGRKEPEKSRRCPARFVDTGVMLLLKKLLRRGCRKSDMVAKVAGGATVFKGENLFCIGKRNYTVVRKILWKNDILIEASDVLGRATRTMFLYVATGQTSVRAGGEEYLL